MSEDKQVLTFDQLDDLLLGERRPNDRHTEARIFRNLHAIGSSQGSISLGYVSAVQGKSWGLARVYRTPGGDTVYVLLCKQFRKKRSAPPNEPPPAGHDVWQDFAERFTPYEKSHGTPPHDLYYVMRADGSCSEPMEFAHPRRAPRRCAAIPRFAEPSPSEWTDTPALRDKRHVQLRARRFFGRVKRELEGLVYAVQRRPPTRQSIYEFFHHEDYAAVHFHVVPFGANSRNQQRLEVEVGEHTDYTRKGLFHLDGDYTRKHILVVARDQAEGDPPSHSWASPAGDPRKGTLLWKCANDALLGITEWVMSNVHIPSM
jgi:hypothetical protein